MDPSLFLKLISSVNRDPENRLNLVSPSFQDQIWGNVKILTVQFFGFLIKTKDNEH